MSATYTRWTHHGEPADAVVDEGIHQEVEGHDHDFGIHVDVDDDVNDDDHGVPEMIGELYAAAEADGEKPSFGRVLEDAKKLLSPGSRHSKFSFMVRMLYMKSRYRINNTGFTAMMKLMSDGYPVVSCQNHMMRPRNILKNWVLHTRTSMCARTIVCCSGRKMLN